jgi:uncharacterized membrane protein
LRILRRALRALLLLVLVALAVYLFVGSAQDPLAGKEASLPDIEMALERVGVATPDWRTAVVAATREVDLPPDELWRTWTELEAWPEWSRPLHVSTRWLGDTRWQAGSWFEQKLALGFPVGTLKLETRIGAVVPGESAMWWKVSKGMRACHLWRFEALPGGRTRIHNVEVFHGVPIAVVRPLVANRWQRYFEASVDGLVARARERRARGEAMAVGLAPPARRFKPI